MLLSHFPLTLLQTQRGCPGSGYPPVDWDCFHDYVRGVTRKNIFYLGASAVAIYLSMKVSCQASFIPMVFISLLYDHCT